VEQAVRAAARSLAQSIAFTEGDVDSPHREIAGDPDAGSPAADHEHVGIGHRSHRFPSADRRSSSLVFVSRLRSGLPHDRGSLVILVVA
jgi:hypothetical protein